MTNGVGDEAHGSTSLFRPNSHLVAALELALGKGTGLETSFGESGSGDDAAFTSAESDEAARAERAVLLGEGASEHKDKNEMSKMQLMELKITEACQEIAGIVLEEIDRDTNEYGPDLDSAMELAEKKIQIKRKELEEELSSMHESIHRMFSEQLEDSLRATRERISTYIQHRIDEAIRRLRQIKHIWERAKTDAAAQRLGPFLVVGGSDGPGQWHCVDLRCGEGGTSLWLAKHTGAVVALDTRSESLYRTRARAVGTGVIESCVVARGSLGDLSSGTFSFAGARRAWQTYKTGGFPPEVTLYTDPDGHTAGALPLSQVQAASSHPDRPRLLLASPGGKAGPVSGSGSGAGGAFELAVDNGALLDIDASLRPRAVQAIHSILKPGGLFFLLWPSTVAPPPDGPPALTPSVPAAVSKLFWTLFDLEQAVDTRFDDHSSSLDLPQPAIALLLRARIVVDVQECASVGDAWRRLLTSLKAPPSHPFSIDALAKSLAEPRALGVERPMSILLRGFQGSAAGVQAWCRRLVDLAAQTCEACGRDRGAVRVDIDAGARQWALLQRR